VGVTPRNFEYENFLITNSAFRWLLIRWILMHGLKGTDFWSQDKVLNTSWTDWTYRRMIRFQSIRSVKHAGLWTRILKVTCSSFKCLLIHMFLTPTTTVMAFFGTAACRVSVLLEIGFMNGLKLLARLQIATGLWLLNLLLTLVDLVTWCNASRPNHPHQNKRKQSVIVNHSNTVAKHSLHHY
jgi:hypothetical protein